MKKCTALILALVMCLSCFACSKQGQSHKETSSTEKITTTDNTDASPNSTTNPYPSLMKDDAVKLKAIYGKRTGTTETYTGLEALEIREFNVTDPENARGISTKVHNHAYGVSKNEKPHEISLNNQKLYEKYGAVCLNENGKRCIYLTFDCGYENGNTEKILDTLKQKDVKAAFFVTLPQVKATPELIARMINEGHIVGNHSVNHPNFAKISRTRMAEEINELDNYLRLHFGYSSPFFRFPEGACSENALELVQSLGYQSVFWSSAYADWDVNNSKGAHYAFETVTSRLHPGCILLLHSVSQDNAEALGNIIDYAKSHNYEFRILGE